MTCSGTCYPNAQVTSWFKSGQASWEHYSGFHEMPNLSPHNNLQTGKLWFMQKTQQKYVLNILLLFSTLLFVKLYPKTQQKIKSIKIYFELSYKLRFVWCGIITSFLKNNPSYHISDLSLTEYQLKQSKLTLIITKREHSFGNVRFSAVRSGLVPFFFSVSISSCQT